MDDKPTCMVSSSSPSAAASFAYILLWVFIAIARLLLPHCLSIRPDDIPFLLYSPFSRPLLFFDTLYTADDYMQPKNGAGGLNGDITSRIRSQQTFYGDFHWHSHIGFRFHIEMYMHIGWFTPAPTPASIE